MGSKLVLATFSGLFVMGMAVGAFGEGAGAVPPAGAVKALEPPIDQRKKQDLSTPTTTSPSVAPGKTNAPDASNKGTTDAR